MCYSGLTLLDNQKIITKIRQGENFRWILMVRYMICMEIL